MTAQRKAPWILVLHAHLPFIRHPEHEYFLEEDWLFEALTETYLPLLWSFQKLREEGIPPRVGLSFSPTLAAMLDDELLRSRYRRHLDRLLELSAKEVRKHAAHPLLSKSSAMYHERFSRCLETFERHRGDLLEPFKELARDGAIEILTCTATHGMIPLMLRPEAVRAQIAVAAQEYRRRFDREPAGLWLGECAYDRRVGGAMAECGFKFFLMDHHGLAFARPKPKRGAHAPSRLHSGVYAFARDLETAKQVWSAAEGYPGDPRYREFYRDLGYDADYEHIRPYLHPDGERRNVGIKYHRVTGNVGLTGKELYDPEEASALAERHAGDFLERRAGQVARLDGELGALPVIVSTYDAELYGHWWFEGPAFLEHLIRKAASPASPVELRTPSEVLRQGLDADTVEPEISSWGDKGYFEVWLNSANDWIYPHLHAVTDRMIALARRFGPGGELSPSPLEKAALNQCGREVLLAQASDWPFMMTVGSHVAYARERLRGHAANFMKLHGQLDRRAVDNAFLKELEARNNIFPELDFRVFAGSL